jgi:transcriptional regulator GlxA family with amidase domain
MDRNIEEPLLVSEIAHHVGVSKRQLERAFLTFLRRRPRELYLNIRLAKGRSMLRNSPLPIREIAFACGFSNSQHFSKSYRDHYECRPTDERNRSMLEHGRGALQDTRLGFGLNPQAMTW